MTAVSALLADFSPIAEREASTDIPAPANITAVYPHAWEMTPPRNGPKLPAMFIVELSSPATVPLFFMAHQEIMQRPHEQRRVADGEQQLDGYD